MTAGTRQSVARVFVVLVLSAALFGSCRCSGIEGDDPVVSEARALEAWLSAAGGQVRDDGRPSRTPASRTVTWSVTIGGPWSGYQRTLMEHPPPSYPPCVRGELTVVCSRTLPADAFRVEVEAASLQARELVARFRASEF